MEPISEEDSDFELSMGNLLGQESDLGSDARLKALKSQTEASLAVGDKGNPDKVAVQQAAQQALQQSPADIGAVSVQPHVPVLLPNAQSSLLPSSKIRRKAVNGEFVHLEDFLPCEPIPISSNGMEAHIDPLSNVVSYKL